MTENTAGCFLRPAEASDEKLLLTWANDKDTRKNSFHTRPIQPEEHHRWFAGILSDKSEHVWIMTVDDRPAGMVRLSEDGNSSGHIFRISYSIAKPFRGKGLGTCIIRLMEEKAKREFGGEGGQLYAEVKKDNIASRKIFESLGYAEGTEKAEDCMIYRKNIEDIR